MLTQKPLIALEGPDGVGKSTQWQLLINRLEKEGLKTQGIKFPRYQGSFFGRLVSHYLRGDFGRLDDIDPHLAAILFAGDRWTTKSIIKQWCKTGHIVIADRYVGSNIAHQTARIAKDKQVEFIEWINQLEFAVFQIPKPILTILFTLPEYLAGQLIDNRGLVKDIHESHKSYMLAVHNLYYYLADKYRWYKIKVNQNDKLRTPKAIHEDVWAIVKPNLN